MNTPRPAELAAFALACVQREFPNQPAHLLRSESSLQRPRELHPAFYGCYDWHSAVHGHWLLAWALESGVPRPLEHEIREVLDRHLTARNLAVEAAYLETHPGFERPYGWAWALKLALTLRAFPAWSAAIEPLADTIVRKLLDWLPRQRYPIRSGTHTNTAFGLSFALDYARASGLGELESRIVATSLAWYGADRDAPAAWEPGGNDFFSPSLVVADLMRRVLPDFERWFAAYLPQLPPSLAQPAEVTDRADGQLAHLDGLNLSRAWCLDRLGLAKEADAHLAAGLAGLAGGHYEGEHWLASFAALALEAREARREVR